MPKTTQRYRYRVKKLIYKLYHRLEARRRCMPSLSNCCPSTLRDPWFYEVLLDPKTYLHEQLLELKIPSFLQIGDLFGVIAEYAHPRVCFEAIQKIAHQFLDDVEMGHRIIRVQPKLFPIFTLKVRDNLELSVEAVSQRPANYQYLDSKYKGHDQILQHLLTSSTFSKSSKSGTLVLPARVFESKAYILKLLDRTPLAIPVHLCDDRQFAKKAVQIRGKTLFYFEKYHRDLDVVRLAIMQDVHAIECVDQVDVILKPSLKKAFRLVATLKAYYIFTKIIEQDLQPSMRDYHYFALGLAYDIRITQVMIQAAEKDLLELKYLEKYTRGVIQTHLGRGIRDVCRNWPYDVPLYDHFQLFAMSLPTRYYMKNMIDGIKRDILIDTL